MELVSETRIPGPLSIALSGSGGLIGSALRHFLTSGGHTVRRLVRSAGSSTEDTLRWDPSTGQIDRAGLEGVQAVVHLAGENIAAGRWSDRRKRQILESRVRSTRLLAESLAALDRPPVVLICASAIGYYGDRGDEWLDESSPSGEGFLAGVCREWEAACAPASEAGIRVANLRFGMVLTPAGGALRKMLPAFRLGLGGPLGSGNQFISWIALDDLLRAVYHILGHTDISGPVNVTAPSPVTSLEFSRALGRVLGRPTLIRTPAFLLRVVLGSLAEELLLASQRAIPARLCESGFSFRYPLLEPALRHLTGHPDPEHI